MESFNWVGLGFTVIGTVCIFSSAYEWTWWWRWARGLYLPDLLGLEKTRRVYLGTGFGILGVGVALIIKSIVLIPELGAFIIGFTLSAVVTKLIYESREGHSIRYSAAKGKTR